MPIYEASCKQCGKRYEWYSPVPAAQARGCPKCNAEGELEYSVYRPRIFEPFTTRNIMRDGRPVTITSEAEHVRICHDQGVVPLDKDYVIPPQPTFEERVKAEFPDAREV